jgi:hypothetical protein
VQDAEYPTLLTEFPRMTGDCEDDSFSLSYYLYHGSFGYYAFYEEASGSYCSKDNTMYVLVTGLGTFDSNGSALATHEATTGYHGSYWYGTVGSISLFLEDVPRSIFAGCCRLQAKSGKIRQNLN